MTMDEDLRTRLRQRLERVSAPDPSLQWVTRRARRLSMRRYGTVALALLLVAAGIGLPLRLLAGIGEGGTPASTVNGYGIHISLPDRWDSRLTYFKTEQGPSWWASSVPLPKEPTKLPFMAAAINTLGQDELLLSLHEFVGDCPCTGFEAVELPISLRAEDFHQEVWASPDHAFAERLFQANGRYFDLFAVFGSNPAPAVQLNRANDILSSLSIETGEPTAEPTEPTGGTYAPPTFAPAEGWATVGTPTLSETVPLSWASSVPISAEDLSFSSRVPGLLFRPGQTIRSMSSDGVVMVASFPLTYDVPAAPGNPNFPDRTLPLQVSDADVEMDWEGQIDDVPLYRILGRVEQRYVEVDMYFGKPHPSDQTLALAQEELSRLTLPDLSEGGIWAVHTDEDDGLAMRTPADWTFREDPSGPDSPRTIFAVGSWAFPTGGECAPSMAADALPADGVLFWLIEYQEGQINYADFPRMPESFSFDASTLAPYECSGVPSYLIRFTDQGRYFQIHVAFGPDASDGLREQARQALDSLVVSPIESNTSSCIPDVGDKWECSPEGRWIRSVVGAAGYDVLESTGSAFVVHAAGSRLQIWTRQHDEPGIETLAHAIQRGYFQEIDQVGGVPVYRSDDRDVVWNVGDLDIWVAPSPYSGPLPGLSVLEALVRATIRVPFGTS